MTNLTPTLDASDQGGGSPRLAEHAQEILSALRDGEPSSSEVFDAFWQLDRLPREDVRAALVAWGSTLPDVDRLDAATRLAHGLPLRSLRLRTLSVAKDADVLDLGAVAEEQIRVGGKTWDGADLSPEERLDGEIEGSFAGSLERRVLADADVPGDVPLFDVLLFEDSGVVFASGTSRVVALIAYGRVELRDRRTRIALEEALRGAPVLSPVDEPARVAPSAARASDAAPAEPLAPAGEREVEPQAVATTAVSDVAVVEKESATAFVAAKKTSATKPSTKPTKKTAAKKAAPAKVASAKRAPKPVAKKAAAKAPAKKTAAKSVAAKTGAKKATKTSSAKTTSTAAKKKAAAKSSKTR